MAEKRQLKAEKDFDDFVNTARKIHGNKYKYIEDDYTKASNDVTIVCPTHGNFKQKGTNHTCLHQGCPKCSNQQSLAEEEIVDYIHNTLGINDIVIRNRNIIPPLELDIYIPSKNIAIEFNGIYWHCELYTDKNYHLNKTNRCIEKGIRLIHIFEDEWNEKKDIIKSYLSIILGKPAKTISAKDCTLSKVENNEVKDFINNNHIKGYCEVKYNFGLYYNKELVSILSFKDVISQKKYKQSATDYKYELICFCEKNDTLIVGGISKLFKYSIDKLKAKEIMTYVDKRWSDGKHYDELVQNKNIKR